MRSLFAFVFVIVTPALLHAATIVVDPETLQLYIVGQITPGDYDRFADALRKETETSLR